MTNLSGELGNYLSGVAKKRSHHRGTGVGRHEEFPDVACERVLALGIGRCINCPLPIEECPEWKKSGREK